MNFIDRIREDGIPELEIEEEIDGWEKADELNKLITEKSVGKFFQAYDLLQKGLDERGIEDKNERYEVMNLYF